MKRIIHVRSSVFYWHSKNFVLFYDTNSFNYLLKQVSDSISNVFNTLDNPDSLYTLEYEDTVNPELDYLVKELITKGFCVEGGVDKRYVSLPPILGISYNWDAIKASGKIRNVTELLRSIVFIMGRIDCNEYVDDYYDIPLKSNDYLDIRELNSFFMNNDISQLTHLDFIIGSGYTVEYITGLAKLLKEHRLEKKSSFFFFVDSYNSLISREILNMPVRISLILSHHPYPDIHVLGEYRFIIRNQYDLDCAKQYIKDNNLGDYSFYPHFDGDNLKFIEEAIFPNINEVLNGKISKRLIFIHQTLNINYFGRLIVSSNAKVYSNPYKPSIGNLSDGIYTLVYNEMEINYLWRMTRSTIGNCSKCVYRDLCPSPVMYEERMNRICPDLAI